MKNFENTNEKDIEPISIFPIKSERKQNKFNLGLQVSSCLQSSGFILRPFDIVVVSSKFAAIAEGRVVKLDGIRRTRNGVKLANKYDIDPSLAELIMQESTEVLGGIPGFALTLSQGLLAPNAGIDRSNVPEGYAVLYPKSPFVSARLLRAALIRRVFRESKASKNVELGVILSDSRISPLRVGTTGVALAVAGFSPLLDFRGKSDLFGNTLKVTIRAVADQIATAAELVMGEADESTPIVVVRGAISCFSNRDSKLSMTISPDLCLYIQGLKNPFRVR